jgi:hypothetical protein
MKKIVIMFALLLVINGCATPIGQRKASELYWKEKVIAARYDDVYSHISEGFRKWGGAVIEGTLYTEKKSGHFDVYMKSIVGGRGAVGAATIDLTQLPDGNTRVVIGSIFGKNERFNGVWWIKFAEGDYSVLND